VISPARFRRPRFFFFFLCALLFVSASAPTAEQPLRFAVIGDSGTGDKFQYAIARQMLVWHDRRPFDLALMLGDNIYGGLFAGGGHPNDFEERFDRPYAELRARGVVFRAALGNHDMRYRDGRAEVDAYDRFHIDRPEGFYNFTAGKLPDGAPLVEFFVLNTSRVEKDKKDPEQLDWLRKALAASRARWRIVYGHHPMYSTGRTHGADRRLRAKLEPLLLDGGAPRVHVVLGGHDHIYQRFHPQPAAAGIVYFVCGSSGQLRPGNARPDATVAAVEDRLRTFMLWEATPEELRFFAVNERGQAFDCGALRPDGRVAPAACPPRP